MENSSSNFTEDCDYSVQSGNQDLGFDAFFVSSPGPDDEEEEEAGEEPEEEQQSNQEGDPALDEEVVHSPVTTETGGRPRTTTR